MRQQTLAKMIELVELVNEQRWLVHEMRSQLKRIMQHSPRIEELTRQVDADTDTDPQFVTLLSEVLHDAGANALDLDAVAEALFDHASPKQLKVEQTIERAIKAARR